MARQTRDRALCTGLVVMLTLLWGIESAAAQSALRVRGPNPSLEITAGRLGHLQPAVDTRSRLRYRRIPHEEMKITVHTIVSDQRFSLSVEGEDVNRSNGVAGPPVDLKEGMPATDLIMDIPAFNPGRGQNGPGHSKHGPPGGGSPGGSPWVEITLRYEATAKLSDGRGTDRHRVIYTYIEQ